MLAQEYRLKKKIAFNATYRIKNCIGDFYFVLYKGREKQDTNTTTKVGFVISKKVHKRAVKRNRAKRLYREAYRLAFKDGKLEHLQKYLSLVFVIKNINEKDKLSDVMHRLLTLVDKN